MNATRNSNGGERTNLGKRIKAVFGATTDTTRRPDRRRVMFQLEGLEQRRVMTASAVSVSALLTPIVAAEIAPQVAAEAISFVKLLGTKNETAALNAVFSPTNIGNVLQQKGLGFVAVNQTLINDTLADVNGIISPAHSAAQPVVSTPVISVPVSSSPVVKPTQTVPVTYVSAPTGFAPSSITFNQFPQFPVANAFTPFQGTAQSPVTNSISTSQTNTYTQELAQANQNKSDGMDYIVPDPPTVSPPSPAKPATPVNISNLPNTLSGAHQLVAALTGLVAPVKG